MTNVIHHNFTRKHLGTLFSADVYSHDMKRYQFEIQGRSLLHAYHLFIDAAKNLGVHFVRCIAVYEGNPQKRRDTSAPLKVWQQDRTMTGLREF